MEMNGKVVVITGAAMGLGLACAEAFARSGAMTIMADIDFPEQQAEKLIKAGYKAAPFKCDVSDEQNVREMIEWIARQYGRLDAAVNNAGIQTPQKPMAEISNEEFERTIAVDFRGVWYCIRYEIIQMLKQAGGAIVNISSQGGVTGFPGQAAYIACKHAIIGLTRTAAIDYAARNIRINALCPGVIKTPMAETLFQNNPEAASELLHDIPAGRFGLPSEVAKAALWLCGSDSSFIDGHALLIDGGFTAH